jgi:hypothetical protein
MPTTIDYHNIGIIYSREILSNTLVHFPIGYVMMTLVVNTNLPIILADSLAVHVKPMTICPSVTVTVEAA